MKKYSLTLVAFFIIHILAAQKTDSEFKNYQQKIEGTSLTFPMVVVPAGNLITTKSQLLGNAASDLDKQSTIRINPFWMSAHEVTYDAYDAFMQDEAISQNSKLDAITRPSQPYIDLTIGMGKSGGFPANSMQQYGALMYCRWLYQRTNIFFRLPSEAEWEYACRAGSSTEFPPGKDGKALQKYAWFKDNSNNQYHKVGELQPNSWGLYDMLGNVAEWTMDFDESYLKKISANNSDSLFTSNRRKPGIVRGGSFGDEAKHMNSATRFAADPVWNRRDPQIPKSRWWNADAPFVGFRIIRPVQQPTREEAEIFFKIYLGQ